MDGEKAVYIGEILKNLREEKGLTQDNISELLGIKRQTYSAWERGVSNPDINTVVFLSKYYDVSTDYLLGKTKERNYGEMITIAAHHDGEWTEEELADIEKFKEFVRMRRRQRNQ